MPERPTQPSPASRVAVVTGASRGIGAAIALRLATAGADIAMVQRGAADDVAASIRELGRRCVVVQADLARPAEAESAVRAACRRLGRLDICVCNAGVIHREPALSVAIERFEEVIRLNLVSVFAVARAAATIMLEREPPTGAIVLVASVLAFQGGLNVSSYAASKAGVSNLAMSLSNEWAARGIRVNAVAPGYIENELTLPLREDHNRKRELDKRIPVGRWGTNEDVADAVEFLTSDRANYLSGTTLVVDGGWLGR